MPEPSEADRYLLDQVRRGSSDAWAQLVDRYQGRLTAFARRRGPRGGADAEDAVQDTFFLFLRGLGDFRGTASVETYLFTILRRRLVDLHRGRRVTASGTAGAEDADGGSRDNSAPGREATGSWYVRREEQRTAARAALASALAALVTRLQDDLAFRDLQIAELVFYAQWKNQRIAAETGADPGHVGLLKHRWLKQLRERVADRTDRGSGDDDVPWDVPEALDSLLTEIWEDDRPSCPKRSTIGGHVLGTLDAPWQAYVTFHLDRVACPFCRANLEDLQAQGRTDRTTLHKRVMQSTVGFFRKPG